MELPDDFQVPDAAAVLLRTRNLNKWLGTSYTPEEVAGMDWLMFDLIGTMNKALFPDPKPKATR